MDRLHLGMELVSDGVGYEESGKVLMRKRNISAVQIWEGLQYRWKLK